MFKEGGRSPGAVHVIMTCHRPASIQSGLETPPLQSVTHKMLGVLTSLVSSSSPQEETDPALGSPGNRGGAS